MTEQIECRVATLGELLAPPHLYQVPIFQRDYDWTPVEAGQLVTDIQLAHQRMRDNPGSGGYFLGLVMLLGRPVKANGDVEATEFQIIDGQQRLATLTILLATIRDLIHEYEGVAIPELNLMITCRPDLGEPVRHRLSLRGATGPFFAHHIQATAASATPPDDIDERAEERLIAVQKEFRTALEGGDLQSLGELVAFMADHCRFAVLITDDLDQAVEMFKTVNTRGRRLDKDEVIRLAVSSSADPTRMIALNQAWAKATGVLDDEEQDRFFAHLREAQGNVTVPVIESMRLLAEEAGGAEPFINEVLGPNIDIYRLIRSAGHSGAPESAEINRLLKQLGRLNGEEWIPPAMLWWSRYRDHPAPLLAFLRRLDRLAYGLRVHGIGGPKRHARMHALRSAIRKGDALSLHSPLDLSTEEIGTIAFNLRGLYGRSHPTCKLVLMRVNDVLAGGLEDRQPGALTIEHVLPLKPAPRSSWRTRFPDADEREELANSLGNLVLVPGPINERARNQDLERKLQIYFPSKGGRLAAITEELRGISDWRPATVIQREARILSILSTLWNVAIPIGAATNGERARRPRPPRKGKRDQP